MDITGIKGPGIRRPRDLGVYDYPPAGAIVSVWSGAHGRRIELVVTALGYRIPGLPGVELELIEDEPPFYEATGPTVDALDLGRGLRIDRKPGRLAADLVRRHNHELAR